ncbi:MAG TPA: VOC family protein, partial [Myxococcales bacterium]|nr:VOC family protein [Myxococcales bacterium]
MKSTSVVLPWSTCAMIATLRICSRESMGGGALYNPTHYISAAKSAAGRRLAVAFPPLLNPRRLASVPSVRGHHHLAIQVKDLPGAVRFYGDVLGLKVVRRWPAEGGRGGERSVWLS